MSLCASVYFYLYTVCAFFHEDVDDVARESLYRGLCFLSFIVACFFVNGHREGINGPCVIVLISADRRTARDPHSTKLQEQ